MTSARNIPERHLPDPEWPVARAFWEGTRAGELRIPRCNECGSWVWYPSAACPGCGGGAHAWTRVTGHGRVFTWVRVHRAFLPGYEGRVPFITALVELDEGVRLATFLRDVPPDGPRIGMRVEVTFERVDDRITLPMFRCIARGR